MANYGFVASGNIAPSYARFYKIDLDTFTEAAAINSTIIEQPRNGAFYNGYLYVVGYKIGDGAYLVKIDVTTFTEVDSIFLFATATQSSIVIDSTTGLAYVGYASLPVNQRIAKVNLTTFTVVSTITPSINPHNAIIDTTGGFAYFSNASGTCTIEKINLTTFTSSGTLTLSKANCVGIAIDASSIYYYSTYLAGLWHARVTVVDLATFTEGATTELTIDQGISSNVNPVLDASGRGYFPGQNGGTTIGAVSRINLTGAPNESVITFPVGDDRTIAAMMYPDYSYALFTTFENPSKLKRIRLSDFTYLDQIILSGSATPYLGIVGVTAPAPPTPILAQLMRGLRWFNNDTDEGFYLDR